MKNNLLYSFVIFTITILFVAANAEEVIDECNQQNSSFVTNHLIGELGNQLFQVATGVALALDHNAKYILPRKTYPEVFWRIPYNENLNIKYYYSANERLAPHEGVNDLLTIEYQDNMQLCGFFMSYKYFNHHKDEIISLFKPSETIVEYIRSKYGNLIDHPNSVGIHIRTYAKDSIENSDIFYQHFPAPNAGYIRQALQCFPQDALFIICSDNITWAKKFLEQFSGNFHFIENEPCYIDFYLLSMCKNIIIGHSTFSWWAAYLNESPNKIIIAPIPFMCCNKRKLEDLYPLDWTLLAIEEDNLIPVFSSEQIFRTRAKEEKEILITKSIKKKRIKRKKPLKKFSSQNP